MLIFRPGYGEYTATDSPAYVAIGAVPASGDVTLSPTGMASTSAFGAAVIAIGAITLAPSAVVNSQAFGAPTVTVGEVTLTATGIASTSAFGSPSATASYELDPTAVINSQAFGSPTVDVGAAPLNATSLVNVSAYGAASIVPGPVGLTATGIASANAYGAPTVVATYDLLPASVVGVQAFGNATIYNNDAFLYPTGLASTSAFGTAGISHYSGFWELVEGEIIPREDVEGEFDMWWELQAGQIIPRDGEADPNYPAQAAVFDGTVYGWQGEYVGTMTGGVIGPPPTPPMLVITDNRDGATATAVISGADTGTANRVYVKRVGTLSWYLVGTVTGSGTLTFSPGARAEFRSYVVSDKPSSQSSAASGNDFWITLDTARRQQIRDSFATASLSIAKQLGRQVVFQGTGNPAPAPVTVWATVGVEDDVTNGRGGQTDVQRITVQIPRQTGFPPASSRQWGSTVTIGAVAYQVDGIKADNEDWTQASTWMLTCGKFGYTVEMEG